jgi:hypothetical protein
MADSSAPTIMPLMGVDRDTLFAGAPCDCLPELESPLSHVHEGNQLPVNYGLGGCGMHDANMPQFGCD